MNQEFERQDQMQGSVPPAPMTSAPKPSQNHKGIYGTISKNPIFRAEHRKATAPTTPPPFRPYGNAPQGNNPYGNAYYNQPVASQPPEDPQETEKRTKRSKKGLRVFCCILALVVIFSIGTTVGVLLGGDPTGSAPIDGNDTSELFGDELDITVNSKPSDETGDNSGQKSITDIYEFVSPSIVEIYIYSGDETATASSYSSGIVMSKDGYILSNDHIYTDIDDPMMYVVAGSKTYKATFVAGDTRRDISILKIDATDLTPAVFGKSSELVIGEEVFAIGNPAQLENSITNGIVSSLDRRVTNADGYNETFIQTNAAISGGSSGGALVNKYGQVVGITSSKYVSTGVEGISFAIPIDDGLEMVADLLKNGKCTTRAKLGIRYQEITFAYAELNDCPMGIMFYSADESSELYTAGIKKGDVITEINGIEITGSNVVLEFIDEAKPGDTIKLRVWNATTKNYSEYTATLLSDEGSSSYDLPSSNTDSSSDREPLFPEDQ